MEAFKIIEKYKKMTQESKNKLLRNVSLVFIVLSIGLSIAVASLGNNIMNTNTLNQIKTELVEKEGIKSNEIDYIRKLDYKFYEIILDNGDVYTFKKTERGKTVIRQIDGDKKENKNDEDNK